MSHGEAAACPGSPQSLTSTKGAARAPAHRDQPCQVLVIWGWGFAPLCCSKAPRQQSPERFAPNPPKRLMYLLPAAALIPCTWRWAYLQPQGLPSTLPGLQDKGHPRGGASDTSPAFSSAPVDFGVKQDQAPSTTHEQPASRRAGKPETCVLLPASPRCAILCKTLLIPLFPFLHKYGHVGLLPLPRTTAAPREAKSL